MANTKDKEPEYNGWGPIADAIPDDKKPTPTWLNRVIAEFSDVKRMAQFDIATRHVYIDQMYENYYMCSRERAIALKKDGETWRSNIKTPLTKMFVDRMHNMITEFDVKVNIRDSNPERIEDGEKSKKLAEEINTMIDKTKRHVWTKEAWWDTIFDALLLGFCPARLDMELKKETRKFPKRNKEVATADMTDKQKAAVANATDEVTLQTKTAVLRRVSWSNFFTDYNVTSDSMRFVIERGIATYDAIEQYYARYGDHFKMDREFLQTNRDVISYSDFESRKSNMVFYDNMPLDESKWYGFKSEQDFNLDETFSIEKKNMFAEWVEVHAKDRFDLYINGQYINTLPQYGPLFDWRYNYVRFKKIPGTILWTGMGATIAPAQLSYDKIFNCRLDNVLLSVNKTFVKKAGSNITGKASTTEKFFPGKIITLNDGESFEALKMGDVPQSAYAEPEAIFAMLQAVSGLWSNILWLQSKVERVAESAKSIKKAADDAANGLIDSLSDFMAWFYKNTIILYLTYYTDEEFDKVLGKDNIMKTLEVKSFLEEIEMTFDVDSQRERYNAQMWQLYLNFLQQIAGLRDEQWRPIANLVLLAKEFAKTLWLDEEVVFDPENIPNIGVPVTGSQQPWASIDVAAGEWADAIAAIPGGSWEEAPNAEWVN